MKVSNVRLVDNATLKAFFSLHLEEIGLHINDCKLVLTKDGQDYFIGFPSKKENNGSYTNLLYLEKENAASKQFQADVLKLLMNLIDQKKTSA